MDNAVKELQEQLDALKVSLERSPGVAHVAIKLPPFWGGDPTLWFKQIEAQFELARITNDRGRRSIIYYLHWTKTYYLV